MTVQIQEALGTLQPNERSGLMRLRIITEGQGSSANYPAEGIVNSVAAFPAGTHIHYDHPTVTESQERPERSVLTLAGALETDAEVLDVEEDGRTVKALEAWFRPLPSEYQVIKERKDIIGASIRAAAEVDDDGNVVRITEAHSVDLVTRAGRGGRITEVIESARREIAERDGGHRPARTFPGRQQVTEATNNDLRRYLSDAVDAYDTENQYAYLQDFDDTYVYFRISRYTDEDQRISAQFRQRYTRDGVNVTLTGEPEEVKPETSYTPTNPEPDNTSAAPAVESAPTATTGGSMEIKEAEYQRLSEAAERVQALESERDAEKARADNAEAALAEADRRKEAQTIVAEAFKGVEAPKLKARLVESAVNTADFDPEVFKNEVTEAAAELVESKSGVTVTGFGDSQPADVQESDKDFDYDTARSALFEGGR